MTTATEHRKLAAIMFTDMVGYSALSQRDDKLAQELLEEHRQLLREIFPRFNGTEIKTIGDAFLVEFNSALGAAQCAIEIQRTLAKRNHDVIADRRIELKIGIHIGDVVHRAGDVYGDGVNIASRIEPLAGAGGICVSMDVERQIRNALEARFEKLAPTDLKNISVAMDLFRIVLPWERSAGGRKSEIGNLKSEIGKKHRSFSIKTFAVVGTLIVIAITVGWWWTTRKPLPSHGQSVSSVSNQQANIPDKSIAVLPLTNEGGAKDEQYFSDGLSEDLITALSQLAGLKVIGRNSSFQFRDSKDDSKTIGAKLGVAHLLEGSVRRAADAVRISAELINAADGTTLWSQHYDRPYKDLFKLQDDITTAVANALKTKLLNPGEAAAQSERPPSGSLQAYNAFLKGNFHFQHSTKDGLRQAIDSYQTAVSLDPKYAQAYAAMGSAQTFYGDYFSGAEAQQNFAMARASINTALTLNPDLAGAHVAHALLLAFADLDFVGAKTEFERAVELAPNNLDAVASLAQMRAAFGHPEAAIEPIRKTLENDPRNAGWYGLLAGDLMAVGRLDEAEQATRQQIELGGTEESLKSRLCTIEVLRGNAAAALEKAEQLSPGRSREFALARARQIGNDAAAASAAVQTLIDHYAAADAYHIAGVYALRRDPDDMFKWLDRAWANRENTVCVLYYDPLVLRYKDDPRFAAFCQKVGLPTPAEVAAAPKP
jgi:TolB-like protein/class 3 adenylate cyclase/Flp pilus assembly protein TadD